MWLFWLIKQEIMSHPRKQPETWELNPALGFVPPKKPLDGKM